MLYLYVQNPLQSAMQETVSVCLSKAYVDSLGCCPDSERLQKINKTKRSGLSVVQPADIKDYCINKFQSVYKNSDLWVTLSTVHDELN